MQEVWQVMGLASAAIAFDLLELARPSYDWTMDGDCDHLEGLAQCWCEHRTAWKTSYLMINVEKKS